MTEQIIRINMRLPGLNEYTRAYRSSRYAGATMKKDAERAVMAYVRAAHAKPASDPCAIVMVFHEPDRRRDADNVEFARKFILDGLVAAGVIAGDSPAHVLCSIPLTVYGDGGFSAYVDVRIISGQKRDLEEMHCEQLGDVRCRAREYRQTPKALP